MNATIDINQTNVGRIAERIVANELEARGFRVSDLNRDGISANADLLAMKDGKAWQVQVKGTTNVNEPKGRWKIGYGYCTEQNIANRRIKMFNRVDSARSYYKADIVVLVAVRSPSNYRCIILRVDDAERAAQLNLDRGYRSPRGDSGKKKPGKVWLSLEPAPREHSRPADAQRLLKEERAIIEPHEGNWCMLA